MSVDLASPFELLESRGLWARPLAVRNQSVDEKLRSFEAVVASETPTPIFDYRSYEVIDEVLLAAGGNFPDHMPLLPNHRRYDILDVIGSALDFRRENALWVGRGIVAEAATDDDTVRMIWSRIVGGHIRAVSIGYQVRNYVDIPAGRSQKVGSKTYTAGERVLRISTEWQPRELSLTPIGADETALIRSKTRPPQRRKVYFR